MAGGVRSPMNPVATEGRLFDIEDTGDHGGKAIKLALPLVSVSVVVIVSGFC